MELVGVELVEVELVGVELVGVELVAVALVGVELVGGRVGRCVFYRSVYVTRYIINARRKVRGQLAKTIHHILTLSSDTRASNLQYRVNVYLRQCNGSERVKCRRIIGMKRHRKYQLTVIKLICINVIFQIYNNLRNLISLESLIT